jgi:hypothetical protein
MFALMLLTNKTRNILVLDLNQSPTLEAVNVAVVLDGQLIPASAGHPVILQAILLRNP